MINIYGTIEDLECTEFFEKKDELKDLLDEAFDDFIEKNDLEYEFLSDKHVVILSELNEEIEDELKNILDDIGYDFIQECEYGNEEEN